MQHRTILSLLLVCVLSTGCLTPKDGNERRVTVRGSFVGGVVSVKLPGGGSLTGQLSFQPGHVNVR